MKVESERIANVQLLLHPIFHGYFQHSDTTSINKTNRKKQIPYLKHRSHCQVSATHRIGAATKNHRKRNQNPLVKLEGVDVSTGHLQAKETFNTA